MPRHPAHSAVGHGDLDAHDIGGAETILYRGGAMVIDEPTTTPGLVPHSSPSVSTKILLRRSAQCPNTPFPESTSHELDH
jgi:hypothetical protein